MWFTRFSAPVLVLIWTAYYFAKRCTGEIVDITDILVCGVVAFISVVLIIKRGIDLRKEKKRLGQVHEEDGKDTEC